MSEHINRRTETAEGLLGEMYEYFADTTLAKVDSERRHLIARVRAYIAALSAPAPATTQEPYVWKPLYAEPNAAQEPVDMLAQHSGTTSRREWHSVGAWLYPGTEIVSRDKPNAAGPADIGGSVLGAAESRSAQVPVAPTKVAPSICMGRYIGLAEWSCVCGSMKPCKAAAPINEAGESYAGPLPAAPEAQTGHVAPSTPDGWKLVPVEPTPEMMRVGFERGAAGEYNEGIWKAMLAAAPEAP